MTSPRSRRLAAGVALSLAVLGTAAACGDDSDDAATDTPTGSVTVTPEACDDYVDLGGVFAGDPSTAGTAIEAFVASAPTGLSSEAGTVADAFTAMMGEDGDPAVFGEAGYLRASSTVADAYFDGCDLTDELVVDGVDFGFEGLPTEVSAGRVGIRFTNRTEHDEAHELVLFRKGDDVTESAEELLALPEEEGMAKLAMSGVVFADAPGSTAVSMVDLEPGSYIAVCFIPVGGGEDGPPHFTSGMVAEFDAR
ncbi:MAG: hypothetical protein M3Z03_02895 [Actinomycetota bacterium]|nr:hypothetical protein [Actinomycetota bacterium]